MVEQVETDANGTLRAGISVVACGCVCDVMRCELTSCDMVDKACVFDSETGELTP